MAGDVYASNVAEGTRMAELRPEDLVILEGSGAAIPPVAVSAGLICLPATAGPDVVRLYLGPYRVLLTDLAIVTMSEDSSAADAVLRAVREVAPKAEAIPTVFRPKPLEDVSGCRVFFCSTAPSRVSDLLRGHLEEAYGCEVVGISHSLADRSALGRELSEAQDFDVLITEIKAGGVDVAARLAGQRGARVVFADNELVGDGVEEAFDRLIERAERNT
jgi:cyclic 2,3-diphosphoglycerate synthetase